ncbi:HAMP domain-containing protein [bacterium]|nr:MAG: HAMP domain-containing protein [bacterium]
MLASMRGRLTLAFASFIALFMVLLCSGAVLYAGRLEAAQLAESLELHAEKYRHDLNDERQQPRTPRDWQVFLNRENSTLRDRPLSMLVLDKQQRVVARTHGNGPVWPLSGDWLVETVQTRDFTLILAARWYSTQREMRQLTWTLALIAVGVVVATALGSWLLVGRVLSPIDKLAQGARTASAEDLRVRLALPSRDAEVVALVATLNDFLDRQARTAQSRERFYAAASHELRTPIQGLTALLEVGLSRPRTDEQWHELGGEALQESRRLGALVQDLLALNQLENQTVTPPASEIDIADIIERMVVQLQPQIQAKSLHLSLDLPDDALANMPWSHVEILLRNLISNAIKYALDGTDVRILLRREAPTFYFSVWNRADLPPDLEADKLFEPFFRLDEARQSTTEGNGLGLALVASICRVNGWKLQLHPENHGLLATVELTESEESKNL